ncbi:tyrosine-type recombinase/integrase [Bradyrhizobium tunisiense]|uniref:tyrosine-type recombinase/integrase n=1 Tax=Bradyrhizobium tunisiense TaxID=3278709 RepID=UPI0035E26ACC
MSVYRDKRSQFYQYSFDIHGRRFSGSTERDDEHAAREIETEKKREARAIIAREVAERRSPLTLGRACERWWNEHGQYLADAKIKSSLDRIVEILGARTQLHDIIDDSVARLVAERRKDKRRDSTVAEKGRTRILYRPITATTVNRTLDLLRRVMRRAKENWNASLPNEPTWKNHRLKEIRRAVREISPAEEHALDAAEDIDYAELRRFAIITGLRRREMLITWPQVDFELAIVKVQVKGGTWRTVPLTREAYGILWRRRGHHPTAVFTTRAQRNWKNWRDPNDRRMKGERHPITYEGLGSHKDRAWAKAGVKARIHDLRHTTGMRTLRKTRNLRVVQELLGHTDIKTTAMFYTAATVDDVRQAMEETHGGTEIAAPAPKLIEGGE